MKILVGHTGFVGSNLVSQTTFDGVYNSKNIQEAYGINPEVLIYSGVPAEKFLANSQPEKDFEIIEQAIVNIQKINPGKIILISTVDVYPVAQKVDEDSLIDESNLQAYGKNRLYLERWIEQNFKNHLIVRLPALFGEGIKKNFIYDIINVAPSMLSQKLYEELAGKDEVIEQSYILQPNGFYKMQELDPYKKSILNEKLKQAGFTALNFTDSRAVFQFYNLKNLWNDISKALTNGLKKINLVTQPVSAGEIYKSLNGNEFKNEIADNPAFYDIHTHFDTVFGNNNSYIADKGQVKQEIIDFIKSKTS